MNIRVVNFFLGHTGWIVFHTFHPKSFCKTILWLVTQWLICRPCLWRRTETDRLYCQQHRHPHTRELCVRERDRAACAINNIITPHYPCHCPKQVLVLVWSSVAARRCWWCCCCSRVRAGVHSFHSKVSVSDICRSDSVGRLVVVVVSVARWRRADCRTGCRPLCCILKANALFSKEGA